jgi:hypothetical protein
MTSKKSCPKCGSLQVVGNCPLLSATHDPPEEIEIRVGHPQWPDCWLIPDPDGQRWRPMKSLPLKARVCLDCRHVELYADYAGTFRAAFPPAESASAGS